MEIGYPTLPNRQGCNYSFLNNNINVVIFACYVSIPITIRVTIKIIKWYPTPSELKGRQYHFWYSSLGLKSSAKLDVNDLTSFFVYQVNIKITIIIFFKQKIIWLKHQKLLISFKIKLIKMLINVFIWKTIEMSVIKIFYLWFKLLLRMVILI